MILATVTSSGDAQNTISPLRDKRGEGKGLRRKKTQEHHPAAIVTNSSNEKGGKRRRN